MMGRQTGYQASLFYEFRLDDRIPKEHLLRRINAAVGRILDSVRGQLKRYWRVSGLELDIVNRALLTQTRKSGMHHNNQDNDGLQLALGPPR